MRSPTLWVPDFNYAEAFDELDLAVLKQDLYALMTEFAGLVAYRLGALWWPLWLGTAPPPIAPPMGAAAAVLATKAFCTAQQLAR